MLNFVVNRVAGGNKAKFVFKKVRDYLNKCKICYRVFYSLNTSHIFEIVKKIEDMKEDVIIVVGGDGTINACINAIEKPQTTKLGVIPAGVNNNFALSLGLSLNPIEAIKTILNNKIIKLDLLNVAGQKAVNGVVVAGDYFLKPIKHSSEISYKTNLKKIIMRSRLFCATKNLDLKVSEKEVNTIVIANGKYVLNGLNFCENAKMDDGKLNCVEFVAEGLKIQIKNNAFKNIDASRISETLFSKIKITSGEEYFDYLVDGELVKNKPCEIEVIKNGLLTFASI